MSIYEAIRECEFIQLLKKRIISEISGLPYEEAERYLSFAGWRNVRSNEEAANEELSALLKKSLEKRVVSKYNHQNLLVMINEKENLIFYEIEDLDDIFVEYYVLNIDNQYYVFEHTSSTFSSEVHEYIVRSN